MAENQGPAEELARLSELHAQGSLSDEEFAQAKAIVLGTSSTGDRPSPSPNSTAPVARDGATSTTPAPIGIPAVIALGEKFVGETLQVAVYGNATPVVKDLSTGKWFGIGLAEAVVEGALGIPAVVGFADGFVEVPLVERLRRKTAKQQVGVRSLRGVVGLYCTSGDFFVAELRWSKDRKIAPRLARIALRAPLSSILNATVHQSGGSDWLRIQVASLDAPLSFSTRAGTNHFPELAAWLTADH